MHCSLLNMLNHFGTCTLERVPLHLKTKNTRIQMASRSSSLALARAPHRIGSGPTGALLPAAALSVYSGKVMTGTFAHACSTPTILSGSTAVLTALDVASGYLVNSDATPSSTIVLPSAADISAMLGISTPHTFFDVMVDNSASTVALAFAAADASCDVSTLDPVAPGTVQTLRFVFTSTTSSTPRVRAFVMALRARGAAEPLSVSQFIVQSPPVLEGTNDLPHFVIYPPDFSGSTLFLKRTSFPLTIWIAVPAPKDTLLRFMLSSTSDPTATSTIVLQLFVPSAVPEPLASGFMTETGSGGPNREDDQLVSAPCFVGLISTFDGGGAVTAAITDNYKTIGFCKAIDGINASPASTTGDNVQMLCDGSNFVVSGAMAAQTAVRFGAPP